MEEVLSRLLEKMDALVDDVRDMRAEIRDVKKAVEIVDGKIDKLIVPDIRGVRNELRYFKSEVKGWQRYIDTRLDSMEGTVERVRDALQQY
jgi:FtsZ-binding cell division protein ZapB